MNSNMAEALELLDPKVAGLFKKSIEDMMQNPKVGQEWQGYVYPPGFSIECSKYAYDQLEVNQGDVFLVSYPKTGTNWSLEVIRQILYPSPEEDEISKKLPLPMKILEFNPKEKFALLDKIPLKRRLFGSHLPAPLVNLDKIKKANAKVVYVLRNPKDQLVSWYNFAQKAPFAKVEPMKTMLSSGWDTFFNHAVAGDFPMTSKPGEWYPEHILYWHAHHDNKTVYFLYFEEMKKDLAKQVKLLAEFLDAPMTDERAKEIERACSFDAMKKAKSELATDKLKTNEFEAKMTKAIMRKGEVGGWKDQLTVRQSELIDKIFVEKLKDTGIKFAYQI